METIALRMDIMRSLRICMMNAIFVLQDYTFHKIYIFVVL